MFRLFMYIISVTTGRKVTAAYIGHLYMGK